VVGLGAALRRLAPVASSTVDAEVAVVLDYPSGWAAEAASQPSVDMGTFAEVRRWYGALWRAGITADFARPGAELSRYRAVFVPALYLVSTADAANLTSYVDSGGTALVGAYSGVVDERDHVRPGGYPGAFTELLGVRMEEFHPLPPGQTVRLSGGGTGAVWRELGRSTGAEVLESYVDGPVAGSPAVTRHGRAWYTSTRLVEVSLDRLVGQVCAAAGAAPVLADRPAGLEAVRRRHADGRAYLFLINHAGPAAAVAAAGTDLLTGAEHPAGVTVPPGGVVVLGNAEEE
jgi:beta-galactosidase